MQGNSYEQGSIWTQGSFDYIVGEKLIISPTWRRVIVISRKSRRDLFQK